MAASPVRLRAYSRSLAVDVLRVVGYRAACSCGWRGRTRRTLAAASQDALAHRDQPAADQDGRPAAPDTAAGR